MLHRTAYALLGLDWEYGRHEVQAAGLPAFLAGLDPSWRGLSLTMPLKEAALDVVDEVSELAGLVRAVNTVLLEPDGRRRGDNTDVPGSVAALRRARRGAGPVGDPAAAAAPPPARPWLRWRRWPTG